MLNLSIKPKLPKVLLRHILMTYLKLETIENVILNVKELNVLDDYSKKFLENAKKGLKYNARNGNLEVIKFLNETKTYKIQEAFQHSCATGHLDVAKWLYSLGVIDGFDKDISFCMSCEYGHIEVAKWLYELGINISVKQDYGLMYSCRNGHIEIAKWLYSIYYRYSNKNYFLAFNISCQYGNLEVAQWLYSLGGIVDKNISFCMSCDNGHLEVAKWLYSLKDINRPTLDYYTVWESYNNGHIEIVKWLYSIGAIDILEKDDYYIRCSKEKMRKIIANLLVKND